MKKNLLIAEPPLQVLPSLAKAIGLNEAIVLQQVHYWLENPKTGVDRDGHKWIFNTYEGWTENFPFWSASTIQRVFSSLEKQKLIISAQLEKSNWDKTKFYRIDYQQLATFDDINLTRSMIASCDDLNKNTETTTENTTTGEKKTAFRSAEWDLLHDKPIEPTKEELIAAQAEEVIKQLEGGLRVNIARSLRNQQVAKRIVKDGRPVADWLSWVRQDQWRAEHLYLYADLEKVWQVWPSAFESAGGKIEVSPDGVNRGKYV